MIHSAVSVRPAPTAAERERIVTALQSTLGTRPEIDFACLHGSFERGEPYRDVDVAVWVDPSLVAPEARLRYALDLADRLTTAIGQRGDVQVLNDAPLGFRYRALAGQPVVVRDWDRFDDLRARTWDDYFDFLPFARQYLREALGA